MSTVWFTYRSLRDSPLQIQRTEMSSKQLLFIFVLFDQITRSRWVIEFQTNLGFFFDNIVFYSQ